MSDPTSPSAIIDGRLPDGGRAMQTACLCALGCFATALTIFVVTLLVWHHNERVAGRMIIGMQKGDGYLPVVASQLIAAQGRPRGF
ncbi:hypothetical protein [Methylobacterium gnaphalii]|uniref:Uncharacterized protein n=1 Tax=Methylobacterium gnaphalii TaxID=1010610 RepID=A0A512JKJ8_9HYPH|nr:hypothetical protein [Methylobacterium gnaphalii]GEP10479.1 hypothetical protein MGN01_23240 [Methylobacterium gnaphalii]GJD68939.1 hypothetical protein MMMDOFMJ_1865 [Methylobacterium gnaphalii]GLS47816.1 hypothetical protein GCM10007885_06600 [Methylobacterium gnaphalii]